VTTDHGPKITDWHIDFQMPKCLFVDNYTAPQAAEVFPKISQKLFSQKHPKNSKASEAFQGRPIINL
jgi:hypothetical protein